jgi:hypothetical protein
MIIGVTTTMQTETSNFWLVVIAAISAFFSLVNIVVLILTLLIVKRYTDESKRMRESMGDQLTQITRQSEISIEMHKEAQRQVEQMARQTEISNQMHDEAQRQTEELIHQRRLSILPAFAAGFSWKEGGTHLRQLILTNIGQGIAINIQIVPINVAAPTPKEDITPEEIESITYRDIALWRAGGERDFRVIFQFIQAISPGDKTYVSYVLRPNEESDKKVPTVLSVYGQYPKLDPIDLLADKDSLEIDFQDIEGNRYHQIITKEGDTFVPSPVRLVDELDKGSALYAAQKA